MTQPADDITQGALTLAHDRELQIATGASAETKTWRNRTMWLSDLVSKLAHTQRTHETAEQFARMPKSERDTIKDVGGFVGGLLKGGVRRKTSVAQRHIITLDADYGGPDLLSKMQQALKGCAYTVYSTHSHTPEKPRLRLLVYPDRPLLSDEYEPVARRIAEKVGIDAFDDSTYEAHRLMYWPSSPLDGEYVFHHEDAQPVGADAILAEFGPEDAWRDVTLWPVSSRESAKRHKLLKNQQNPLEKRGLVGAYCRAVSIREALSTELQDVYRLEDSGRYTYLEGTTLKGLVIYDELFAFSNHGSDPAYAQLCNAFDLVRIHRFGHLDAEAKEGTPTHKMPSFRAMSEYCRSIKAVKAELVRLNLQDDFGGEEIGAEFDSWEEPSSTANAPSRGASTSAKAEAKKDEDWVAQLQTAENGEIKATFVNALTIMQKDPKMVRCVKFNKFAHRLETPSGELWQSIDSYRVREYIGKVYSVDFPEAKIEQAIEKQAHANAYHPIRDYLESLSWDGVERVSGLFVDWFRCEDNIYTREAAVCWMVAAVARVFEPGYKFDYAPVLSGAQGIGKSTFFKILGRGKWYGELLSFDEKLAVEAMQGRWIMEINEMGATNKHDIEVQKQFLSATQNTVRMAYARQPTEFKRQCVFAGTTNESEYLRDLTGERRLLPIDCGLDGSESIDFDRLESTVDQLWAEAHLLYQLGTPTVLSAQARAIAQREQASKRESDPWEGVVMEWLGTKAAAGRYQDGAEFDDSLEVRDRVCVIEVWFDCLKMRPDTVPKPFESRRIGAILSRAPGWRKCGLMRFGSRFGHQKAWRNTLADDPDGLIPF